jgi:hypothetical protein
MTNKVSITKPILNHPHTMEGHFTFVETLVASMAFNMVTSVFFSFEFVM